MCWEIQRFSTVSYDTRMLSKLRSFIMSLFTNFQTDSIARNAADEVKHHSKTDQFCRTGVPKLLQQFAATIGIIILSPVFLLTALLVRLESPGAVFYSHIRVGALIQVLRSRSHWIYATLRSNLFGKTLGFYLRRFLWFFLAGGLIEEYFTATTPSA